MKIYYSDITPTPCELGDVWINGKKHYAWSIIDQKKETIITDNETYIVTKPVYGWYGITKEEAEKLMNQQYG